MCQPSEGKARCWVQATRSILTNNWDCWSSHVVNIIQWHWSTPKISLLFWCSLISVIWISTRQSKLKYLLLSAYQKQKNEIWRKLHLLGTVGKMCPTTRVIYFIISISLIFHFFLPIARVLWATCCPQALAWETLALKHLFSECVSLNPQQYGLIWETEHCQLLLISAETENAFSLKFSQSNFISSSNKTIAFPYKSHLWKSDAQPLSDAFELT